MLNTDEATRLAREKMVATAMEIRAIEEKKRQHSENSKKEREESQQSFRNFSFIKKITNKFPQSLQNISPFFVRLLTGTIYLACILVSFWFGNIPTMVILSLIAGMAAGEFYYMIRQDSRLPNEVIGITGAILYIPAMNFWGLKGCAIVTLLLLLVLLVWYVFWMKAKISDVGISLFGAVYTGGFLSGFMYLSSAIDDPFNKYALILIFLSVCANDSFAYLIGSLIGKHKLAPRTSPNKSWEGFIAGLIGCSLIWSFFSFIPEFNISLSESIIFGIINGLLQVLGDLAESRIKRNAGFKDSGFILPGHGGLLDRCDSLFLASISSSILFVISGVVSFG